MAVAAPAQCRVALAAAGVVLGCDACPMIERMLEPLIAGVTADDDAGFAAGGSPEPPRRGYARHGNLAGVEAATPHRAARRGWSCRSRAWIAGSPRRGAGMAAPVRLPPTGSAEHRGRLTCG